jgi:hypothetical protein
MTETKLDDPFEEATESVDAVFDKRPSWLVAVVAGLLVGTLAILTGVFGAALHSKTQAAAAAPTGEVAAIEAKHTSFSPSTIEMDLLNNSDKPVSVAQLFVQDQYTNFEGAEDPIAAGSSSHVIIDYPWIEGHPYAMSFVLGDGSLFETTVTAGEASAEGEATPAPTPTPSEVWYLFAIALVAVVGVIGFGIPALRKSRSDATRAILGVSAGLLAATAVIAAYFAFVNL